MNWVLTSGYRLLKIGALKGIKGEQIEYASYHPMSNENHLDNYYYRQGAFTRLVTLPTLAPHLVPESAKDPTIPPLRRAFGNNVTNTATPPSPTRHSPAQSTFSPSPSVCDVDGGTLVNKEHAEVDEAFPIPNCR